MLDRDGRAGCSGPLERGLDLSDMAVPLYWAEGGQVVRVCGSRISLDNIIARYRRGYTPQMIADSYPSVELADIHLLISYYLLSAKQGFGSRIPLRAGGTGARDFRQGSRRRVDVAGKLAGVVQ